jgi:hypothetical protein
MLSTLAVVLAALQTLASPADRNLDALVRELHQAPAPVQVIARPEASDLFLTSKTRTTATAILAHNPELIRAEKIPPPYHLGRALELGWQTFRGSGLPGARAYNSLPASVVPEPGSALLLSLSSLLLLRRRRAPNFDVQRPLQERVDAGRRMASDQALP